MFVTFRCLVVAEVVEVVEASVTSRCCWPFGWVAGVISPGNQWSYGSPQLELVGSPPCRVSVEEKSHLFGISCQANKVMVELSHFVLRGLISSVFNI